MSTISNYLLDILLGLYTYTYPIPLSNKRIDFGLRVPRPQGFIVSEVINGICAEDLYEHLARSAAQEHLHNTYCTFIIRKINIDTLTLAQQMSAKLRCKSFYIIGLKEARAITYQAVILAGCKKIESRFSISNEEAWADAILWFCSTEVPKLIHNANRFHITIIFESYYVLPHLKTRLELLNTYSWYMLNFFGYQRFGSRRPITHILGKNLLMEDFQEFLNVLCHPTPAFKSYTTLEYALCKNSSDNLEQLLTSVVKHSAYRKIFELYINAYQSYLFNKLLSSIWLNLLNSFSITDALKKLKSDYRYLPIPGHSTKVNGIVAKLLDEILTLEGININSFCIKWLKNSCFQGDYRESLMQVSEVNYIMEKDKLRISFLLQPGSYATVVLRELLCCNPLLYT